MFDFMNSSLPVNERVDDLIARMSIEEKISQMVHDAPAIDRLEVPAYNWWNEGLHGVGRAGMATVFPQAIGLAATWNPDLMHRLATAISDEARAKHHEALRRGIRHIYTGLTCWSPNVNIFRDPRWGRGQETYGEDPYLSASLGVPFIKGLEGDDSRYLKLVATPKHFAVHSGPESERHSFDSRVNERDLHQTYLPQFEACIKEGGAHSIMSAYNRLNGEACCASPRLLQDILREEWGFEGFVVSDCWAIADIYAHHKIVETAEEAAALAVNSGCELNCGDTYPALRGAVEQGLISEDTIDLALKRLFTARFCLGMFDAADQVPYAQIPYAIVNSEAHQALALQAARESIVLLKNEGGLLPLSKDIKSIAVIGPNADNYFSLLGNYNGTPQSAVTPLGGIRNIVASSTQLYFAQGCALAECFPPLEVIPTAFLFPSGSSGHGNGLTAAYYDNTTFEGQPVLELVDEMIDSIWKDTSPLTNRWADGFSIRWTGYLVPPISGTYQVGVNGFSNFDLYIDDELFVTYTDIHHPRTISAEVELEAGRFYQLKLDYVSQGLDPQVQLLWSVPGTKHETRALEAAEKADIVVAVMGLSPSLEGEELPVNIKGFSGGDRTDIGLPEPQEALLRQLVALGKPVVLVLLAGSALAVDWAAKNVPAIVQLWYPGQSGGDALADVLFGEYNPSGRLPVTFYESLTDLPEFKDYSMEGRTYRYFRGNPLFPFGHGLSYTSFHYDNLLIDSSQSRAGGKVEISAQVTNCGKVAGEEVVQLYVRQSADLLQPNKELKGFKKITLQPGERKTVTFTLFVNQLGLYDVEETVAVFPGEVEVMLGSSSACLPLKGAFNIAGRPTGVRHERVFFSQ